jgi:hypothetical protein
MSRPSKPKPAPAVAAPETPHPAAPQQPETTGAESAPAPVSAATAAEAAPAPVDPIPEVETRPVPTAELLIVKGPAKGRWRAGRKFGPEPVEIAVVDLSQAEIALLEGDPELTLIWGLEDEA